MEKYDYYSTAIDKFLLGVMAALFAYHTYFYHLHGQILSSCEHGTNICICVVFGFYAICDFALCARHIWWGWQEKQ